MTQCQVDLRKEQEQLLKLEVVPLTYFISKEQTENHPLTTVIKDLENKLNEEFSNEDDIVRAQNIIAKKDIKPEKVYSSTKVKSEIF